MSIYYHHSIEILEAMWEADALERQAQHEADVIADAITAACPYASDYDHAMTWDNMYIAAHSRPRIDNEDIPY